jgi:hypothetical protein
MTNIRKILPGFLLSGIVVVLFIFVYRTLDFRKSPSVAIVRLVNNNLEFVCLDNNNCLPNIDLNNIEQPIIYIDSAFYKNPDTVDIILVRSDQIFVLLEIDLKNNHEKYITLPEETLPPLRIAHTDAQVIIGDQTGHLFFIQGGGIREQIKLVRKGNISAIAGLFVRNNDVVVFSPVPVIENERTYAQVWLIHLNDFSIDSQLLQIPNFDHLEIGGLPQSGAKYASRIIGVSEDLTNVYVFYYLGVEEGVARPMLGMFNTSTLKETSSLNVECVNMAGYVQTNGILYSSRSDLEGSSTAAFINLRNLTSLDVSTFTQNEMTTKLIIAPFDKTFLFGTNSTVFIVTPTGKILKKYNLPLAWHDQNYVLIAFSGK